MNDGTQSPNADIVGHRDGCTCYWCYVRNADKDRRPPSPNGSLETGS